MKRLLKLIAQAMRKSLVLDVFFKNLASQILYLFQKIFLLVAHLADMGWLIGKV